MKIKFKKPRARKFGKFSLLLIPLFVTSISLSVNLPSNQANAEDIDSWGPQNRATFSWEDPSDYVTFNSIIDNPLLGDERNFVRIRKAGSTEASKDNINLEIGQQYEVSIWFHNDAKAKLNKSENNYVGLSTNTRVLVDQPAVVHAGNNAVIKGTISSNNANPQAVWDMAFAYSDTTVALNYVPNSATIHLDTPGTYDAARGGWFDAEGFQTVNGEVLDADALFGFDGYGGAKLAYWNDSWGTVPACNEYLGYVTYLIQVDKPNFEISKTVSKDGDANFGETISVHPGDVLEFKLEYNNTGTTVQNDVIAKDTLPQGLTYIEGTTFEKSSRRDEGAIVQDDLFTNGLNLGDFAPGDSFYLTYKARVEDDTNLFPCGDTTIYNDASIGTQNGTGYDKAEVTVSRTCDCATNPEMAGCQELPYTGPVEIAIATLIIGGIGGAGYYFVATRRNLKRVESSVFGPTQSQNAQSQNAQNIHHKPHYPKHSK